MQRPPSFVLLDPDCKTTELEELVEFLSDAANELPQEEVVFAVPPVLDKSQLKPSNASQSGSILSVSIKDQDSCSTSTDECPDIAEIFPARSRKNSAASSKSNFSPEEVVIDSIRGADEYELRSESKVEELSHSENDVRIEPLVSLPRVEFEPVQRAFEEADTSGNIPIMENSEKPVNATYVRNNECPNTSFFLRIVDMVAKISEITGHIDNSSKLIGLCVLLLAVLIPAATICMISSSPTVAEPTDFSVPRAFDLDTSSELIKCRSTLNWRQEKIDQLETKVEKLKATLKDLQKNYGECRDSLSEYQEKNSKCANALKETKQMLKLKEELYENSRSKVLELQEKIIDNQQEKVSDHRPFLQKAFDKIFGCPTDRKFREHRGKWRH
ncbi:hypothetical protein Aperf_G00000061507 [Anoplocephala perfoliata]